MAITWHYPTGIQFTYNLRFLADKDNSVTVTLSQLGFRTNAGVTTLHFMVMVTA